MPTGARARIKINNLLYEAGWRMIDSTTGKANVKLEAALHGFNWVLWQYLKGNQ